MKLRNLVQGKYRPVLILTAIAILSAGIFFIYDYTHHIETDDAQITGHIYPIVSRIAGYIAELPVRDNEVVDKDALLVRIDPRDVQTSLTAAKADVSAASAVTRKASADLTRYKALAAKREISEQEYDAVQTQVSAAEAALAEKTARLDAIALQLSYTTLTAPAHGVVSKKEVELGQYIAPGQTLMAIVDNRDLWVLANFKETQLRHIKIGQPVKIRIDAYPGTIFKGHIDSIQWGTGATFSLLPPENATGNYVKIVQRVPVKIVFDQIPDARYVLAPGMSAIPEVALP